MPTIEEIEAMAERGEDTTMHFTNYEKNPRAVLRQAEDGTLVLDDPMAHAVVSAIEKANCRLTFDAQKDRVDYFIGRMLARFAAPDKAVIVIANVDTTIGRNLSDHLMPGAEWDAIRATGATPYAQGLLVMDGVLSMLQDLDEEALKKLVVAKAKGEVGVLVIDYGVVEVFSCLWPGHDP